MSGSDGPLDDWAPSPQHILTELGSVAPTLESLIVARSTPERRASGKDVYLEARTCHEAVSFVPTRSHVTIESGAAEPTGLTSALFARRAELDEVVISAGLLLSGYDFLSDQGPFRLRSWFPPTSTTGTASPPGFAYIPLTWMQVSGYLRRSRPDIALIQVSPANRDGWCSFGVSASHTRAMVDSASLVIAEVNENMPTTFGNSRIHKSEIDVIVHVAHDLHIFPRRSSDTIGAIVAETVASLVPKTCLLQLGIGAIPDGVARVLARRGDRVDIRLLSQLSDAGRELLDAIGSDNGQSPHAVVGEIAGSLDLYRWAANNFEVAMADVDEMQKFVDKSASYPLVTVNSALEIDLFGQVNTEFLESRQIGLIGGCMDFASASRARDENLFITALKSLTSSGHSRIVPRLQDPVSIPRSLVHILVTEHGVANLRDLTVAERAKAIASLADPIHREILLTAAAQIQERLG